MVTIDDMIEKKVEGLSVLFGEDGVEWFRHHLEINHMSVDDGINYLDKCAVRDIKIGYVHGVYDYFSEYCEKMGYNLE